MLEEGIAAGLRYLGRKPRVLAHVERDAFAAAVLLARMESEALEPSPVWAGNLEDVRLEQFHGCVDILCAGFPCQPHSMAGSRKGTDDARWIWPAIADCIRAVEPGLVLLENVSGLRSSGGFAPVLADLAALGFRVEWDSVRASDVGASHQRERVFILAYRASGRLRELRESSGSDGLADGSNSELAHSASRNRAQFTRTDQRGFPQPDGRFDGAMAYSDGRLSERRQGKRSGILGEEKGQGSNYNNGRSSEAMDDANGAERRPVCIGGSGGEQRPDGKREADCRTGIAGSACLGNAGLQHSQLQQRQDGAEHQGAGGEFADTDGNGFGSFWRATTEQFDERDGRLLFAPGPSDPKWPEIIARWPGLAPATSKCKFCRLVDGLASGVVGSRTDRLRCGGNGVVPAQAGLAFVTLARRAGIAE